MHPILIDLGPIELPSYGLLMAAAFLMGLWLMVRLARGEDIDPDHVSGLWVSFLLAGLIGSKLTLYLVDWRYYWEQPGALLTSWRSAGVYYGGFIAAALTGWVYMRRHGLPFHKIVDLTAPALAVGQAVGRWGCFAAGCCYGKPTTVPWAVTFTNARAREITGVPLHHSLHPTQVYLSLNAFLLCGVLLLLLRWKRRRGLPDGVVFWTYVVLYGATRFGLEVFRNDPRGSVGALSTSQGLGLGAVVLGLVMLAGLFLRRPRED